MLIYISSAIQQHLHMQNIDTPPRRFFDLFSGLFSGVKQKWSHSKVHIDPQEVCMTVQQKLITKDRLYAHSCLHCTNFIVNHSSTAVSSLLFVRSYHSYHLRPCRNKTNPQLISILSGKGSLPYSASIWNSEWLFFLFIKKAGFNFKVFGNLWCTE